MKVKLNVKTSLEGRALKVGDEIDIPLNVAQRWINRGIAHDVKEELKPIAKSKESIIFREPVILENKPVFYLSKESPESVKEEIIEPETSKPKKKK